MQTTSSILYGNNFTNSLSSGVSYSSTNQLPYIQKHQYDSPTMSPYSFIHNNIEYDVIAIKANMGVGKTQNLRDIIYSYDKVVILSFRISLDKQFCDNFDGFMLYSDIQSKYYETDVYNKMVIQIDSFNKIRGDIDLLILDEVTYSMSQLIYSKKREINYEAVNQYLGNNNTKIIMLDALLEDDILNYMKLYNKNILYVENTFKKHIDKKIINYGNDYGLFINNIMNDILHKKRIVIATNSKSELTFIKSKITKKYKNKKKWLFIDADSDDKLNIDLWDNLDILGYTPTISAGVSYTGKNFDKVYGYFVNGSASAEIAVQQLFRIRNLNDNEINICVDITNGDKYPTNDEELDEYIINRNKCLCKSIDFVKIDFIKNDIIKDNYYYWYKCVIKREYLSYNNYLNRIIELLKTQGITNISNTGTKNIENDKEQRKLKREHNKEKKIEEWNDIFEADILTSEEYENIKDKINKNRNEKLSCKRYKFKNRTKIEEKDFNAEVYGKFYNHLTKLNNLAYIKYSDKNIIKNINKRINYSIKKYNISNNTYKLHESKRFEKLLWVLILIKLYGFDIENILKYNKEDYKKIDKNKIKDFIINNHKSIDYAFGIISKNWKEIIDNEKNWFTIMNRYVNSRIHSMLKITLKRKVINRDEYVFINGLDFWNVVTYDNKLILKEIEEQEIDLYKKIDEEYETKEYENFILEYINSDKTYEEYFGHPEIDPSSYYDNCNKYL